ncbi:hypothetical protein ABZ345_09965 [Lentzea sp. NPDC005914]|uniref:hypothetical protein n=1 Tax=Lentzea sp. NPDC005914 TaxID=3154572 RepID=UPI0033E21312
MTTVVSTVTSPPSSTVDLWFVGPAPTDVFAAWGQWGGALGSIAAVAVALAVLEVDRRRRKRDEQDRRVGRARTVIATAIEHPTKVGDVVVPHLGVEIANHGQEPVLEVVVEAIEFVIANGAPNPFWVQIKEITPRRQPISLVDPVLGAGGREFFENEDVVRMWNELRHGRARVLVTITFLDTEGNRWRRTGNDAPQQIKGRDAAAAWTPS